MDNVLTIILGGGKGTRLYPLTKERSKPAVPFAARYRIVDIPLSNSINSDFKKIYVLTQFNTASLHLHLAQAYQFDSFSRGFVEILAAEQGFSHAGWYEGTADAVRKNMHHFKNQNPSHYLILSGDQLYRMDLKKFFKFHIDSNADITIATTPVKREDVYRYGIVAGDDTGKIYRFWEKPDPKENLKDFDNSNRIPDIEKEQGKTYLASMGIYMFKAKVLEEMLDSDYTDFGKEVIPSALVNHNIYSYVYTGYWVDIGTIKSFYQTQLSLATEYPDFDLYDEHSPIYTRMRHLPPSKFSNTTIDKTLTGNGCIIKNSSIKNSVIGIRTIIRDGSSLDGVICMGSDYYETAAQKEENIKRSIPHLGIGRNCHIKNTIIDKNSRIGDNCRIGVDPIDRIDGDYGDYYIRDNIIIILKNRTIPSGTVI